MSQLSVYMVRFTLRPL